MKRITRLIGLLLIVIGAVMAVFGWLGRREKGKVRDPVITCYDVTIIEPVQPPSPDRATKQDAMLRQFRDAGRISPAVADKRLGTKVEHEA